jgi:glutamyl-tRNA reductase
MRKRQALPLAIIDIAVPRNVEPGVEKINNVFLYNIDDLTQITDLHREQRKTEIESALAIIADEVNMFASWWRALDVRPVVSALMEKAEDIRSAQLKKTLKKLPSLSDKERKSLEAMTRSIVTKILKDPVQHLKVNSNYNPDYTDIVSRLFRLDRGKE